MTVQKERLKQETANRVYDQAVKMQAALDAAANVGLKVEIEMEPGKHVLSRTPRQFPAVRLNIKVFDFRDYKDLEGEET